MSLKKCKGRSRETYRLQKGDIPLNSGKIIVGYEMGEARHRVTHFFKCKGYNILTWPTGAS